MNHTGNTWDKDALKNPEIEYQSLLSSLKAILHRQDHFAMFFVRCSPNEGEQIMRRIRADVADPAVSDRPIDIQILRLDREIADFYATVVEQSDLHDADIVMVTGIEEFLECRAGELTGELANDVQHIPRPIAHLSLAQPKLKAKFPICFVFLLPLFALKFFIDSYPELFDEEISVFEFPTDMELLRQETFRWGGGDRYELYAQLSEEERDEKYEYLQKLIAAQPLISDRRVELLLEQGGLLVAGNRCKEAIANCDLAINIRPHNHLAWYNRAVALDLSDRHEEAIANYRQAIVCKADLYVAWHNMGTSLSMLGRYEEAITSFDNALKFKPDYHYSLGGKGLVYSVLGKHDEAIACCEKALALNPDYVQGWFSRAYALESIGKYEEAVASYDRALESKPHDHQIWYGRAKALECWGNYTEAISSYNQALELRPDDYYAWNNRGLALSKLELYEEAIASHDQALAINPNDHFAWYSRGNALSSMGRLDEALNCYDRAIQISPHEPQIRQNRRLALRRMGFDHNHSPQVVTNSDVAPLPSIHP